MDVREAELTIGCGPCDRTEVSGSGAPGLISDWQPDFVPDGVRWMTHPSFILTHWHLPPQVVQYREGGGT